MGRLTPLDLSFFVMESAARPMHSGATMILDPPPDEDPLDTVERTLKAFRGTEPVAPWNQRAVVGLRSLPHWETVPDVDLEYHVRRIALPAPGSMVELMELVSHLYPAQLDRTRPLWEAYVIDGLEHGRIALFLKGHHAAADGVSAMRMVLGSLDEAPHHDPRAPWGVGTRAPSPLPAVAGRGEIDVVVGAAKRMAGLATAVPKLLPASLRLLRDGLPAPFSAARTETMAAKISTARSFATFDLPLDEVKRVAKRFDGKVNDVMLSVCDDAMHRYLLESEGNRAGRLVTLMAFTTRPTGDETAGNAVAGALVALGAPEALPNERLGQIVSATKRVKAEVRRAASLPLQLKTMSLIVAMELREDLPIGRGWVPNVANLILSNLPAGPRHPLYLGRAKLAGLYVAPLVPPSTAVNFTVLSYDGSLCVGVGAARNIIPYTRRLAELATQSFTELAATVAPVAVG
jgi:diacylglycerol O-acyltransferase / wax synthase